MDNALVRPGLPRRFPRYGWVGLILVLFLWPLNWALEGLRTHWGFFPLWLGYCLTVDAINYFRTGTSLITRNPRMFIGLFLISAPLWWSFELVNWRTQNWLYLGREFFSDREYFLLASLSFSTVVPAVMGTGELFASFHFIRRLRLGPRLRSDAPTTHLLAITGLVMFVLLMFWPQIFFPFTWIFLVFMLEPINVWLGNRSSLAWTNRRDWRPMIALWLGVLTCGFFWEMWNYFSYPKWVYSVPYFDFFHIFEMPLLGYLGYLPFAAELLAVVHWVYGMLGQPQSTYLIAGLAPDAQKHRN